MGVRGREGERGREKGRIRRKHGEESDKDTKWREKVIQHKDQEMTRQQIYTDRYKKRGRERESGRERRSERE